MTSSKTKTPVDDNCFELLGDKYFEERSRIFAQLVKEDARYYITGNLIPYTFVCDILPTSGIHVLTNTYSHLLFARRTEEQIAAYKKLKRAMVASSLGAAIGIFALLIRYNE